MKNILYLVILLVIAVVYAMTPVINLKAKVRTAFYDKGI